LANEFASSERAGEQLGQFSGLIDAMNGTKDQFNRPLCGDSLRFERIGKPHAANHEIGLSGTDAIQLFLDVLSLHDSGALREKRELLSHLLAVQVGSPYFHQFHAALSLQETSERKFELRFRQQKNSFAVKDVSMRSESALGSSYQRIEHGGDLVSVDLEVFRCGFHPAAASFRAQREGSCQDASTTIAQQARCCREVRLRQQDRCAWSNSGQFGGLAWGQAANRVDANSTKEVNEAIFDGIGERSDHQQLALIGRGQEGD